MKRQYEWSTSHSTPLDHSTIQLYMNGTDGKKERDENNGWCLVKVLPSKSGYVAFWKKEIKQIQV
jgi:NOL1/NOP2/fmu family ribosome biogenesis protein